MLPPRAAQIPALLFELRLSLSARLRRLFLPKAVISAVFFRKSSYAPRFCRRPCFRPARRRSLRLFLSFASVCLRACVGFFCVFFRARGFGSAGAAQKTAPKYAVSRSERIRSAYSAQFPVLPSRRFMCGVRIRRPRLWLRARPIRLPSPSLNFSNRGSERI